MEHGLLELVPGRDGRNSTLWPDWTWRFRRQTRRFDPDAHTLRALAS